MDNKMFISVVNGICKISVSGRGLLSSFVSSIDIETDGSVELSIPSLLKSDADSDIEIDSQKKRTSKRGKE